MPDRNFPARGWVWRAVPPSLLHAGKLTDWTRKEHILYLLLSGGVKNTCNFWYVFIWQFCVISCFALYSRASWIDLSYTTPGATNHFLKTGPSSCVGIQVMMNISGGRHCSTSSRFFCEKNRMGNVQIVFKSVNCLNLHCFSLTNTDA